MPSGRNRATRICAVFVVFRPAIQILALIVFVGFLNPNWKKVGLWNVFIAVVGVVRGNDKTTTKRYKFPYISSFVEYK